MPLSTLDITKLIADEVLLTINQSNFEKLKKFLLESAALLPVNDVESQIEKEFLLDKEKFNKETTEQACNLQVKDDQTLAALDQAEADTDSQEENQLQITLERLQRESHVAAENISQQQRRYEIQHQQCKKYEIELTLAEREVGAAQSSLGVLEQISRQISNELDSIQSKKRLEALLNSTSIVHHHSHSHLSSHVHHRAGVYQANHNHNHYHSKMMQLDSEEANCRQQKNRNDLEKLNAERHVRDKMNFKLDKEGIVRRSKRELSQEQSNLDRYLATQRQIETNIRQTYADLTQLPAKQAARNQRYRERLNRTEARKTIDSHLSERLSQSNFSNLQQKLIAQNQVFETIRNRLIAKIPQEIASVYETYYSNPMQLLAHASLLSAEGKDALKDIIKQFIIHQKMETEEQGMNTALKASKAQLAMQTSLLDEKLRQNGIEISPNQKQKIEEFFAVAQQTFIKQTQELEQKSPDYRLLENNDYRAHLKIKNLEQLRQNLDTVKSQLRSHLDQVSHIEQRNQILETRNRAIIDGNFSLATEQVRTKNISKHAFISTLSLLGAGIVSGGLIVFLIASPLVLFATSPLFFVIPGVFAILCLAALIVACVYEARASAQAKQAHLTNVEFDSNTNTIHTQTLEKGQLMEAMPSINERIQEVEQTISEIQKEIMGMTAISDLKDAIKATEQSMINAKTCLTVLEQTNEQQCAIVVLEQKIAAHQHAKDHVLEKAKSIVCAAPSYDPSFFNRAPIVAAIKDPAENNDHAAAPPSYMEAIQNP